MKHHTWIVHLPMRKYARMQGPDRIDLDDILKLVFPKSGEKVLPPGVSLPDSDSDDDIRSIDIPRRPADPAIWKAIPQSYTQELKKKNGGYSIYDFYIPIGDIYVFIKERLVEPFEELQKTLDAYDFNSLAEAVHIKWRLILLEEVRENKKRKRELDEALDLVEYSPVFVKKFRGDSPPEPSGLE